VILSENQRRSIVESLDSNAEVCLWHGSVRAGKTLSSIIAWCEFVRTAPPGPLVMIGKTKDTIRRNVLDEIDQLFGETNSPLVYTPGANEARLFGRLVHIVGANDAKSESRIRGMTLMGAYVDEATLLPGESFWSMLRSRFVTTIKVGGRIFATTNPDAPGHWFKKATLDDPKSGTRSWHFGMRDNPTLTDEDIARAGAGMSALFRKRFIDGLWSVAAGAIYDSFDPARHVLAHEDMPLIQSSLAVGIDWGTTNPTRGLRVNLAEDDRGHLVSIDAEWAPPINIDTATQTRLFREWQPSQAVDLVYVDPAAKALRIAMQNAGIVTHPGHNAVVPGIATVASLFASDRIVISERCANLIEELPGYVWDAAATAKGEDKPVKANDHAVDALRYGVHSSRFLWQHLIPISTPDTTPAEVLLEAA
jgi:phage terminase large subunit